MCKPGDTAEDLAKEARILEAREGIRERRVNGEGNGRFWDAFWKVLSLLVIPWATGVTLLLLSLSNGMTEIRAHYEDMERRVINLETQMAPTNRFYRWDGDALDERINELESLHPRKAAELNR